MDHGLNIPFPVSYSPLKHHFSYQLIFIRRAETSDNGLMADQMIIIGNNAIDVYSGNIPVIDLCDEIVQFIAEQRIHNSRDLAGWIGERGYREVPLSDGSRWVIRLSENAERFVHIHPGKKSSHTFRLRGTTLKTVLSLCILQKSEDTLSTPDLSTVNRIRKDLLGLSPVKNLTESSRILIWFQFYMEKIKAFNW